MIMFQKKNPASGFFKITADTFQLSSRTPSSPYMESDEEIF